METELSVDDLPKLKAQLESFQTFIDSIAYRSFIASVDSLIATAEAQILSFPPSTFEDTARINQQHGFRDCLISQKTFFEDARTDLEKQVSQLTEMLK